MIPANPSTPPRHRARAVAMAPRFTTRGMKMALSTAALMAALFRSRLSEMIAWSVVDVMWALTFAVGVIVVLLVMNWKLGLLVRQTVAVPGWFPLR